MADATERDGSRWTTDPDLHLLVDGVRIAPSMVAENAHVFRLTLPADDVRLVSRVVRPIDVDHTSDTRLLGVAVSGMRLQQGVWKFDIALDEPELVDGFYDFELDGWRWTNGDAGLPHATFSEVTGAFLFIVFARAATAYPAIELEERGDERLMLGFESLGDDCEFGFVQRHHQAEPMGLLRWANVDLATLQSGLDSRFEGLGEPGHTELVWADREAEYTLVDRGGFIAHTWITEMKERDEEARIKRYGCMQLRLLRRKLLSDMENAKKIFVFKSADPAFGPAEQQRLHQSLRRIGPGSLLCVRVAGDGDRAGHVEDRGDGLFVGALERFVLERGPYHAWRSLCRQANMLHLGRRQTPFASAESRVA